MQNYQRFWITGLTIILILFCQFMTVDAQIVKSKITTIDADDTYEPTLSQPSQFLRSVGIMPEIVKQKLSPHPRILVTGAGSTRVVGLVTFVEVENIQPLTTTIKIVGAGSVRSIKLVELPIQ